MFRNVTHFCSFCSTQVLDMNDSDKLTYQFFNDEVNGERRDLYIV